MSGSRGFVAFGDVVIPEEVADVLNKGPKYSYEPTVSAHDLLALNRSVSNKAGQEAQERCLLEGVEALKKTVNPKVTKVARDPTKRVVSFFEENNLRLLQADKTGGFFVLKEEDFSRKAEQAIAKNFVRVKPSATRIKSRAAAMCKDLELTKLASTSVLRGQRVGSRNDDSRGGSSDEDPINLLPPDDRIEHTLSRNARAMDAPSSADNTMQHDDSSDSDESTTGSDSSGSISLSSRMLTSPQPATLCDPSGPVKHHHKRDDAPLEGDDCEGYAATVTGAGDTDHFISDDDSTTNFDSYDDTTDPTPITMGTQGDTLDSNTQVVFPAEGDCEVDKMVDGSDNAEPLKEIRQPMLAQVERSLGSCFAKS
ncbi:hypothetical protein HPB50_011465 [Hyalomma asiaticum]|uniref:Uncharacterized protein n=1 Tax=Hyalomma asiaticum TaxID=266040 RepID=A0ACB7TGB7_HYAAI|nr:hypothetical protein HPB50_011465 [Hyalomma asiaticum]